PCLQGSLRREASDRGASCRDQPDLLWRRRRGQEGFICPRARVPGLRYQPPSRPPRRQKQEESRERGLGNAFRGRWRRPPQRTEHPPASAVASVKRLVSYLSWFALDYGAGFDGACSHTENRPLSCAETE